MAQRKKNHTAAVAVELAPLRKQSVVSLAVFLVVLPALVVVAMLAFPGQAAPPVAMVLAAIVAVAIAGVLLAFTRRRSIALTDDGLVIRATFYTRRIPYDDMSPGDARVLDLQEHPESRPLLKTNGLAVPGLAAGHFRDRQRKKLFCLITGPRVVMLPLSNGSSVITSPAHPQRFLDQLRDRAGQRSLR